MAKTTRTRTGSIRSEARREDIRRNLGRPSRPFLAHLQRTETIAGLLLGAAFVLIAGLIVIWARDAYLPPIGRILEATRHNRVGFLVADGAATEQKREAARREAPRIYRLNTAYLDWLGTELGGLPRALAGKTDIAEISEDIVTKYRLTPAGLVAIEAMERDGKTDSRWDRWIRQLQDQLERSPILESREYQTFARTLNRALVHDPTGAPRALEGSAIEMREGDTESLESQLDAAVRRAGFPPNIVPHVVARIAVEPRETATFDAALTDAAAADAAARVQDVVVEHRKGDVIYRRGDRLTAAQLDELVAERLAFLADSSFAERWLPRFGLIGLIAMLVGFVAGFVTISYPRILRNPLRVLALFALMAGLLAASAVTSVSVPQIVRPAALAPTLFVAIVTLLAYDRRLAAFISVVQCALVTLALDRGVGFFTLLAAGCGAMILQLRILRQRHTMIRAAFVTGAIMAVGTVLHGMLVVPVVEGVLRQWLVDGGAAFASSVLVGFLALGMLPSIEKAFDITTGMTLAELRDPSRPLLRQLQQRAPGTYNHSLMVAAVAEAAADAIGADSLLLSVGALYHDVGKMNKPEYFVENQSDGFNRHARLRPAMSLLVIIGHVKDGMELAREYKLPRAIQHFIESHHGTTLVEYFWHAAREQAHPEDGRAVEEAGYRYPGPKPQTKEAAILMLSDCVESATRAMSEPSAGRIEAVVRELVRRRLEDGQLSDCDLTFRELRQIEDAMIQRLVAIHHGRIAYPKGREEPEEAEEAEETPARKEA